MYSWKHSGSLMWPSFSSSVLELDWCLSWVVQLDWSWTELHKPKRMSFYWLEHDWMILWGSGVHLDWSCLCWTGVVEKAWQSCACWTRVVHLGWIRSACWFGMLHMAWKSLSMVEEMHKEWRCACWTGMMAMDWESLSMAELVTRSECLHVGLGWYRWLRWCKWGGWAWACLVGWLMLE